MQNLLVSVLIPCYNVSEYVGKAIQSILDQTYTNLEILVIDDASTDDTLSKIQSFNDNRIRVIEFKDNTKKIGAVNEVLVEAKGDLICFQDSDDWSSNSRIEKQVEKFMQDPTLGICFTNYQYLNKKDPVFKKIAISDEELKDEFLSFGNRKEISSFPTICATMMVRKEVIDKIGGYHPYFSGRVAEDIHWIFRILKLYKGVTLEDILYYINQNERSLTGLQFMGKNAKAAYSWQLLAKIIYKDIFENTDVLDSKHSPLLKELELEACEEALVDNIQRCISTQVSYRKSYSYRIGNFILLPIRIFKGIITRVLHSLLCYVLFF